jgi:hypothetical protein
MSGQFDHFPAVQLENGGTRLQASDKQGSALFSSKKI